MMMNCPFLYVGFMNSIKSGSISIMVHQRIMASLSFICFVHLPNFVLWSNFLYGMFGY